LGVKLIEGILKKAENMQRLKDDEIIKLFKIEDKGDFNRLMDVASQIRNENRGSIKLTSTIHLTNKCKITPKCKYCGFAAGTSPQGYYKGFSKKNDEILRAAREIEKAGIPRVSCSGAHGYNGKHAIRAAKIVKENTSLELLINVGSDLKRENIQELAKHGTDTICCNLETINRRLFHHLKPGETLEQRIKVCELISEEGLELSSGLLIGIGETYKDRIKHLRFLKRFKSLGEIPIMGFNPYKGTPMEKHPACPLDDQMKTIAVTRILYPHLRITVPAPTIGPENVKFSLIAGADNIATIIPDNYPIEVKGVGSPHIGNLKRILKTIKSMGLKAEIKHEKLASPIPW